MIQLQYLSNAGKTFLAKSGGHGYSATLHEIQSAAKINMKNFNYVNLNSDLSLTVSTGARFSGPVDVVAGAERELSQSAPNFQCPRQGEISNVPAAIGACPCIGALGAMLGGGLSRLQGLHGLTSDAVRSARVALWNGTIVNASADINEHLFWGLRGAGQNFDIVIEATFNTYPPPTDVNNIVRI